MAFLGRAQDGQEIYQGHQKEHEMLTPKVWGHFSADFRRKGTRKSKGTRK